MAMTPQQREALLSSWIKPSSDDEQDQQDRACRMVQDAVKKHEAFKGVSMAIYVKGSYANNTNVRRDSDVDVVVENQHCMYSDADDGVTPPSSSPYTGIWLPKKWRMEVALALTNAFAADHVTKGTIALTVDAVAGSRPSIDVVPSYGYYRYMKYSKAQGSCVWPSAGSKIVNWPAQQLANGVAKNNASNRRYKRYARALKHAENHLVTNDLISALPSYLMECLAYNVPNDTLKVGSLDYGFQETLRFLYLGLGGDAYEDWVEPNGLKWLFRGDKKWTVAQAKELILRTWRLLDY